MQDGCIYRREISSLTFTHKPRVKVREDQIRSAIKKIHADFVYN